MRVGMPKLGWCSHTPPPSPTHDCVMHYELDGRKHLTAHTANPVAATQFRMQEIREINIRGKVIKRHPKSWFTEALTSFEIGGHLRRTNRVGSVGGNDVPHPGERTSPEGKPISNIILLTIPDDEFAEIRRSLEYIELPARTILHEPKRKLEFAYFLNSGMTSLVFNTNHGESVEVGLVGKEGFTPIPAAAGLRRTPHQAVMQVGGDGFHISLDALESALKTTPQLQQVMNRYAAVHGMQSASRPGSATCTLAIADAGQGRIRTTEDHARFSGNDAGHRPAKRKLGGGHATEEEDH